MKKQFALVGVLLATAVVTSGCYLFQQPALRGESAPTPGSGGPQATGPIKIGYVGPFTGEAASLGGPGIAGAQTAVQEINDAGGVFGRQLELITEDDECSSVGVNAFTKLVNVDKVVGIVGPTCSSSAGPALPIAQQAGVPVILNWASAPNLTLIGDYIFRIYPSDAFQGRYIAEFLVNTLGKKKAAVIYVKNDWGQGLQEKFVERFTQLGGEVVFLEGVLQDSRDFRTQLGKVLTADAEALFMPTYPASAAAGLKQARELGLQIPILGGDAWDAAEVLSLPDAEGVMYSVAHLGNSPEFQQRVEAATGKKADKISASMAYDGVWILVDAMRRAGTTEGPAVRDALKDTSFLGVSSELIEFDENGDLKAANFQINVVRGGAAVPYAQ